MLPRTLHPLVAFPVFLVAAIPPFFFGRFFGGPWRATFGWVYLLAYMVVLWYWYRRWLKVRRWARLREERRCPHCGYDMVLHGSLVPPAPPLTPTCPVCGTPF